MTTPLNEPVSISLPKGTLLVLFELLSQSYDLWRRAESESPESAFVVRPDAGERTALWHLEGAIERILPEVFAPDYPEMIGEWKRKLTSDS